MSTATTPAIRFVIARGATGRETPPVHSIPCRVDHTGPAKVKEYFHADREIHPNGRSHQASFRGRPLDGCEVTLPDGYRLHAIKERPFRDGESKVMEIHATTDRMWMWNLDREPSERDPLRRAIDYVKIARELARDQ